MNILLVGASGTVGQAVANELEKTHTIIRAGRNGADVQVDLTSEDSIRQMYETVGRVDAVISTAGSTHFGPLSEMTPADNQKSIDSKSELLATYLLRKLKWKLLGKTVLSPATVMDQARRAVPALKDCQSANINRLMLALMSRS
ncbi:MULTISPECIES: NAD-dependent epimerase/dehydratase family protein [unclassified Exiguobacterium]|uniref:NAD-dependent epimerase/dehydratase family protein n=1 Tax=unclassified Exiguobacterium TaxID=2644629 RepID=UPI001BE79116|nr:MULTISPECIES: NAD-dependent epimerase/dehydratase family protein [unclassified Exiguobacterium]